MLWGVFLWFLSLHEQRKEPARPQGEWKLLLLNIKSKVAGFPLEACGNDEQGKHSESWIPAYAGMTSKSQVAG
jgi:hypothetical protein